MNNFTPTAEQPILVTDSAIDYLVQATEAAGQDSIRIVAGMSCGGLQYQMGWDESTEEDVVLKFDKFKLLLGPDTVRLMSGTTVDFITSTLGQAGFSFDNPNAPSSGCGSCASKGCGSRKGEKNE